MQETCQKSKIALYEELLPQVEELIRGEFDVIANLANLTAILHDAFSFWWTGFYLVKDSISEEAEISYRGKELVLGPFQGPVACTRISYGKGVCGTAWKERRSIIVEDVKKFSGHIACSLTSLSEIVVPLILPDGSFYGVLDIDSDRVAAFDEIDREYLTKLADIICKALK